MYTAQLLLIVNMALIQYMTKNLYLAQILKNGTKLMNAYPDTEIHRKGIENSAAEIWQGDSPTLLESLCKKNAGTVQLIYLDPPFATGHRFSARAVDGSIFPAYSDDRPESEFWTIMDRVLKACRELLCSSGSIYLHCDYRTVSRFRLMLDSIFKPNNFMNEIIWHYKSGGRAKSHFPRKHDNILFYRKSGNVYFNIEAVGFPRGSQPRNHMKKHVDRDGNVNYSIKSNNKTYYYPESSLIYPTDVWSDINHLQQRDPERTGYATQKPIALLDRIVKTSSAAGDLVLDPFSGSGTTGISALQNARRFLGIDSSMQAIRTIRRRILCNTDSSLIIRNTSSPNKNTTDDEQLLSSKFLSELLIQRSSDMLTLQPQEHWDYIALGSINGREFTAQSYSFAPFTNTIEFHSTNADTLHIVNKSGEQFFVSLASKG